MVEKIVHNKSSIVYKVLSILVTVCMIVMLLPQSKLVASAASDDQVKGRISASKTIAYESDIVDINISLEGIPYEGKVVPNDVVVVLDRSGSMSSHIPSMISAVQQFIDMVDLNQHSIGVVAYDHSVMSTPLNTDKDELKQYVSTINYGGSTRIDLGINEAVNLLGGKRPATQGSIVLLTDGEADDRMAAIAAAENAKSKGYAFYTIAFCSNDASQANQDLKKMATSEADHYRVWGADALSNTYAEIAKKIGFAYAKDVEIKQNINSTAFSFVPGSADNTIPIPTINGQSLTWNMNQLGKGISTLSYQIKVSETVPAGAYYHAASGGITYTDYNGNKRSISLNKVSISVKKYGPKITNILPAEFDTYGGDNAVITGNYFEPQSVAKIGSTKIPTQYISKTQLKVTMPAHKIGSDNITVTNSDTQVSNGVSVEFKGIKPPPVLTVSPSSGLEKKTQKVIVSGVKLKATSVSDVKISVGNEDCKPLSLGTNNSEVTFYVPSIFSAGKQPIKITDSNGVVYYAEYEYIAVPPPAPLEVTGISPSSGLEKKTQKVTVTGKQFAADISNMRVKVGGTEVKIVSGNTTQLVFYVPNTFSAGVYDVVVTNLKTVQSDTTSYEYLGPPPPTPLGFVLTPNSGPEKKTQKVTITGTGFNASTSYMSVTVGGTAVKLTSCSTTQLAFYVPSTFAAGVYDVVVTNKKTGSTGTMTYTYIGKTPTPVVITNINPNSGEEKKTQKVTITGTGFDASTTYTIVTVGGEQVKLTSCSTTQLSFYVPSTISAGVVPVVVTNKRTGQSATTNYEYKGKVIPVPPVTITNISPDSGEEKKTQKVTITGTGFDADSSKMSVKVGTETVKIVNCSTTQLSFYVPDTISASVVPVEVTNIKTGQSAITNYEYTGKPVPVPTITSVTPNSTVQGSTQKVVIIGTGFKTGANFAFYIGSRNLNPTSVTATKIEVYAPGDLAVGSHTIHIVNGDGAVLNQNNGYTVTPSTPIDYSPSITSITPNTCKAGTTVKVTVSGNNLQCGMSSPVVTVNGSACKAVNFNDKEVTFYVPSNLSAGSYTVEITNCKNLKATTTFTYN